MTRLALLSGLWLAACAPEPRDAAAFADDPATAERVLADCAAGRSGSECEAAREGLAEARRRARMAAYAEIWREP